MKIDVNDIQKIIQTTLEEDCPEQDATSVSVVPEESKSFFKIIAKEPVVVCGMEIAKKFFLKEDPEVIFSKEVQDGKTVESKEIILSGTGKTRAILKVERSALNVFQRLCGIATSTRAFVERAESFGIKILDTRKTTPGLRKFEKYAVSVGGGTNHRFGLSDMILLKENHLMAEAKNGKEGNIERAIKKCREKFSDLKVEVEIQFPEQAEEACRAKADVIMLDNMSPESIKDALSIINKRAKVEVSGGVALENIDMFCIDGVDFISVGALTHSVRASDLSLLIENVSE